MFHVVSGVCVMGSVCVCTVFPLLKDCVFSFMQMYLIREKESTLPLPGFYSEKPRSIVTDGVVFCSNNLVRL